MARMKDGPQQGGENLTSKAAEVGENLRDLGSQVRDQAREKYEEFSGQAKEYYDKGRQAASEWEENLESYVKEQPLKALLIAAGVGVLLGILWKRS